MQEAAIKCISNCAKYLVVKARIYKMAIVNNKQIEKWGK